MTVQFNDKVVFVTGASGGIGWAVSRMFAQAGAKVVMADMNEETLNLASEQLVRDGYDVSPLVLDVADETQVKRGLDSIIEKYGRLDLAYNNVGIHAPVSFLVDAERKDFDKVIAVNLGGVWNCMKYEITAMLKNGNDGGRIVNCSSQSGLIGSTGIAAYTASKHAVLGLTKCAALEYARQNIRINAICPGTSDTPMVQKAAKAAPEHMKTIIESIPLGRMGKPDEIASAVLWLCSDYAGFAIGQTVAMDGGYTIM